MRRWIFDTSKQTERASKTSYKIKSPPWKLKAGKIKKRDLKADKWYTKAK